MIIFYDHDGGNSLLWRCRYRPALHIKVYILKCMFHANNVGYDVLDIYTELKLLV